MYIFYLQAKFIAKIHPHTIANSRIIIVCEVPSTKQRAVFSECIAQCVFCIFKAVIAREGMHCSEFLVRCISRFFLFSHRYIPGLSLPLSTYFIKLWKKYFSVLYLFVWIILMIERTEDRNLLIFYSKREHFLNES